MKRKRRDDPRLITAPATQGLSLITKASLAIRVWAYFGKAVFDARRLPMGELTERVSEAQPSSLPRLEPRRLGLLVHRLLRFGRWRARCIHASLVLFRLLVGQGERPELVIGLPTDPMDEKAHAWVELRGVDIGPPPGRGRHIELARYP